MVGRFTWHVFVISKFVCFLHDVRMMYGTAHLENLTLIIDLDAIYLKTF